MRVLIVIDSVGAGGAEKSMVEFGKFLHMVDNEVVFYCQDRREISFEDQLLMAGIDVQYFKSKIFTGKVQELNIFIKKYSPEIVHSVLVGSNLILRGVALLNKNFKLVQSLVNTPYSTERKKDSKLPWQKFLLAKQLDKWSARVVPSYYHPITETVYRHYKPLYRIKDNYNIIHRGRYENKFLGDKVEQSDNFVLINVGRQQFAKGQLNILKALKYLEYEYNIKNIKLTILGIEGQSSSELKNFVFQNNLESRVQILGFVNDVEKRLVEASAFIFPSYYEGLGGALIEAFAAKLPCICSDLPVLREVVGSDKGALFCSPGDYKCLGEQILKLYLDENLRSELSNYSYSKFQSSYRMETINKQMLNMYRDVIKS